MTDYISKNFGKILIAITLIVTFWLWILAKPNFDTELKNNPLILMNQMSALFGAVLFSWSFFTSTRLPILENWFGGLDKVYGTHKQVSIWGFVFIILHPFLWAFEHSGNFFDWFLAIHHMPGVNNGVISFWIFFFLIMITLFIKEIKMPYHHWKFIHKFINLAMFFALLHILTIKSDVNTFLPLGIWIKSLVIIGLMSGIYKTFLYKYLTPKYEYKITKITKYKDVYDILLEPITSNNNFKFTSGQYVYLSFLTESKKISTESHPFCIASASFENTLRFTIKQLGDFTSNLDELKIDDKAIMRGPHGEIGERFSGSNEQNKDAIFIGGGIGIAPFLSLFKTASIEKTIRKTTLFHCTKYKKEAYFDDELKNLAKNNEKLKYFSHSSHKQGHLQAKKILNQITDKENTIVYLCGPNTMMSNLSNELIKNKFNKNNIVLEDFEIF